MDSNFDKNIKIIPKIGLGGISIGTDLEKLKLNKSDIRVINSQKFVFLLDDSIFVSFSSENKVEQVSALRGYEGKLINQHYIGESINYFMTSDLWFFSESEDGFINTEISGVVIRCDLEDATFEEIKEQSNTLTVSEISVYKPIA